MKRNRAQSSNRFVTELRLSAATAFVFAASAFAETPVERFLSRIDADASLPAAARAMIRDTWAKCADCDAEEFLMQGLSLVSERFREGLDAYDAERYEESSQIMRDLPSSSDPFLAAYAAAYEVKALVAAGKTLEAGGLLQPLIQRSEERTKLTEYSYLLPELDFLRGFCLLTDLQYDAAREALEKFLNEHPTASQRLTVSARQMLGELSNREGGGLGEVSDLMEFAGRRLRVGDAGETVQERQDRVVDLLDRLIEEAKKQEQQSSSSSGSSGGSGRSSGQRQPSNPMQDSTLPGGSAQQGTLREARKANPGEAWGSMPPAERERILQALREGFPSRYRKLVEQYYEQLAKKP